MYAWLCDVIVHEMSWNMWWLDGCAYVW